MELAPAATSSPSLHVLLADLAALTRRRPRLTVWLIAIALGVVAAIVNLPIDEREIRRTPKSAVA